MPDKKSLLSDLGEFGLIKNLQRKCVKFSPDVLKGIGDDAAVVKIKARKTLITTDMLLEGIHFDLSFTTFFQLGYKTLSVNISDILAMAGKPKYFLLSLGIPKNYRTKDIEELYSGIIKLAKKFGIEVVGGDTCASAHGLVLSGTLIGEADKIVMRSGAKEGDGIFVSGTLGDSAMGLMLLKKIRRRIPIEILSKDKMEKIPPYPPLTKGGWGDFQMENLLTLEDILPLLKRHLMPEQVPLENTSGITSMIDVSDGLLIDLSHICDESKAGAIIYLDRIPISEELVKTAKKFGIDPLACALKGGEDYVLLFTSPSKIKTKAVKIGKIITKGRFLVDARGKKMPFKAEGYEHFKTKSNIKIQKSKLLKKK